jgi:GTP cyclohydrolase I
MLKDIQNEVDDRNLTIDKVGIKDINYPIRLQDKSNGFQETVAKINMYVQLPHNFKGTHMSRFVEILNKHRSNININSVEDILDEMLEKLDSEKAHIELSFPYFINKTAPVSKQTALMDYNCSFIANAVGDKKDFIISVVVPVMSLCPCSKEISNYGAHNQRSYVNIKVKYKKMIWIEEIVEIAESSASSPIYSLLKREDEKFVTEYSYKNPVFVEDIVRNVAEKLLEDDRITWFEVSSENFESIHNHSAFAVIEREKI